MLRRSIGGHRCCLVAQSRAMTFLGYTKTAQASSFPERCTQSSSNVDQRLAFSSGANTREDAIKGILESQVKASKAVVHDISGGCGSMYKIEVESALFRGKSLVAQHRMVKDALKAEIADMHGLTLHTKPSSG